MRKRNSHKRSTYNKYRNRSTRYMTICLTIGKTKYSNQLHCQILTMKFVTIIKIVFLTKKQQCASWRFVRNIRQWRAKCKTIVFSSFQEMDVQKLPEYKIFFWILYICMLFRSWKKATVYKCTKLKNNPPHTLLSAQSN